MIEMATLRAKQKNSKYLCVQTTDAIVIFNRKSKSCRDWQDRDFDELYRGISLQLILQLVEERLVNNFDDLIRQLDEKDMELVWQGKNHRPISLIFRETVLGEHIDWNEWSMTKWKPEVKAARDQAWAQIRYLGKLLEKLPYYGEDCECGKEVYVSLDFFIDGSSRMSEDVRCANCGGWA